RTLIEAARTMLTDSKLPTTFWAEAVNTACYVHNRVLVVKPHNKTPYELFRGRTPALSFMRPFGCHVTIINILDYLGDRPNWLFDINILTKSMNYVPVVADSSLFDSSSKNASNDKPQPSSDAGNKDDDGLSKQSRIDGDGPKWLFDIDILTKSMNYVPVFAGTNSNDFVGIEESIGAGHSSKEIGSNQDYILMPLWKDISLFDSSSKNASNDEPQPSSDAGKKDDDGVSKESGIDDQEKLENNSQDINTAKPKVDMSNITNTYLVPSTPNTRIYKDHSLDHVIGDEELLQFKLQKVWVLVDLPKGNRAIGFMVYQMDVKSAFLYGYIEEEVYVDDIIFGSTKELCSEFEKLMHDKFQMSYMGELTFFLELQVNKKEDGIFISQDKYVAKILRKFCFTDIRTASTPMDTKKPLLKDSDGDDVDVHINRSMIGSLMYLTSSRPYIMFVCKKQTVDATSSTEAEYVATASFYGQKPAGSDEFHQIVDFLNASHIRYALTANPTVYVSLIKQFWQTATAKTLANGEIEITATIDDIVKTVTRASTTIADETVHEERGESVERAATIAANLDAEQDSEVQGRHEHDMEPDFEFTTAKEVYTAKKGVSIAEPVSTAGASVSTAGASSAKDKGKGYRLKLIKKKGRGFPEYKKKDYNQRKERCTLKLKKQDCLQSLSMRERDTLLHKEQKKGETSHLHKLNRGLTFPEQGMNVEALQTKYLIIDWKIYTEGARKYWKIIRVSNHTKVYQFFDDMLKAFDREDLVKLWCLVKEKFTSTEPTEDKERELWVELKRLFEPDTYDEL
ncbi:putative ribonuclease H-like domain-containing protein, partial [Tanacetum coccineum]